MDAEIVMCNRCYTEGEYSLEWAKLTITSKMIKYLCPECYSATRKHVDELNASKEYMNKMVNPRRVSVKDAF